MVFLPWNRWKVPQGLGQEAAFSAASGLWPLAESEGARSFAPIYKKINWIVDLLARADRGFFGGALELEPRRSRKLGFRLA